ncbi:ankyrin repeat-containing domain protein [Phaeosphaeriaceae sp. PMI808]|nr:ankyrin repeat-containing domain protein [Phaeosphaeriaceae sp. PMI808]
MRLLYTSRHIDDTAGTLSGSTLIDVHASEADIRTYVQGQLQSKIVLRQFCREDPTLENSILQAVVSKAEGMFLAARLYLESLSSKTNRRAVKKALHKLPTTLDDSYDEAMERIKQQPTQNIALGVLSWVVYAMRPLLLEEVQHAVAADELEPDDVSISEESLTPQSIIVNACAGLIKIDEKSNIIGLVHKTTQEYFDRSGTYHFPQAQRDIATTCLKYLSLEVFSDGHCTTDELYERRLRENALLKYAARSLGNHIHKAAEHGLHGLALKFFLDKRKCSCASQALFVDKKRFHEYSQRFPKDFQGVHHAAYFGLAGIIQLLLEDPEVDPDSNDSYYGRTPLSWATIRGHEAVVKLLVDTSKVDVDSKDNDGRTPLSLAAESGYEAVVKLLVNTGKVDVSSKDSNYGQTPLSWAAKRGHEVVVKLLVDIGKVDVDSKDNYGQTPLSWAAARGHEAVVKLLKLSIGTQLITK